MAINKFRKRLALMVATISAASPMSTFAATPATPTAVSVRHEDITSFDDTGTTGGYTEYNFKQLEDAILDAINLIEGTTASAIYGTDVKGEHSTSQVYYWATPEHKSTYDTKAKALLTAISQAQLALSKLSSNYANLDTTLNKANDGNTDVTTPGLLHGDDVYKQLGTNTTDRFNMAKFVKTIAAVQDALNRGLVRTTGSATQYQDAVAAVDKAITSSQSLLATTSSPLTTKSGLNIPNLTTGTSIKLSYLDGDDITSGQSWVAVEHYTKLKEEVENAKRLLNNLLENETNITEAPTKTQLEELEDMADKLFGRDTTTPSNLAAVPKDGSLYEEFLSNAKTATADGDIAAQRRQMEYLLIDALKHTTDAAVSTTADNIDVSGKTENEDGDNTYYLTDPRDNSLIYKFGNEYLSTTAAKAKLSATTATVTYVTEDTDGHEGSNVIGSWVKVADWANFETAITDAITTYKELDGNNDTAEYTETTFTTDAAIDYLTNEDDYIAETNKQTARKIKAAIKTLKQALTDFTKARKKGELGKIAEEKGEFLEVITEAQKTRGYETAAGYTTDTAVTLSTTHYAIGTTNVVTQSAINGTDVPEAKAWVTTPAWATFETAITEAIETYNDIDLDGNPPNALSLTEIEEAIEALEDATRDFDRVIEDEGLQEDYDAAIGTTNGLKHEIGEARTLVGTSASIAANGELRADTTVTVQPSIDGSDIDSSKDWVETSEYTDFVQKIMEAEAMVEDEEDPNQLTKHELDDIVDMKKELADAITNFNSLTKESTSRTFDTKNTALDTLITTAKTLWISGAPSNYNGFDLLTTTITVTKIDGTTQGNYKTFEVKPDSSKVVSGEASDALFEAIINAIDYQHSDNKNLELTLEAIDNLQAAMDEFEDAQTPASGEKFTLFKSIYGENGDTGAVKLIRETKTSEVEGADILKTDQWVTLSQKTAFTNVVNKSIGTLENETVKEATVQDANEELNNAKDNFNPQEGTEQLVAAKNDLAKKINEAKYWVFDEATYIESSNDDSVTPSAYVTTRVYISDNLGRLLQKPNNTTTTHTIRGGELWVSKTQHTSFKNQIKAAEVALNNARLSDKTLETAKNNLQKQMDTFLDVTAQKAYTATDFAALDTNFGNLIRTTKSALYGMENGFVWGSNYRIQTSDLFGADIAPGTKWATKADVNTLNNALKVADGIYDKRETLTYDSFKAAFETFKTATETFTKEKYLDGLNGPGTHQAALWGDIVAARTTLATRNRSEVNGEDIPTNSDWIDHKSYDAFKAAINTAEGTITKYTLDGTTSGAIDVVGKRFNQSIFNNAQKTLKLAKEKFLAVTTQAGLGSLANKKVEYLKVINTVTGLIGVDKYTDTSGKVTTTAFTVAQHDTDALTELTNLGYSLGEDGHDGIEGIRKSNENNGVDVENKHLWLPSTQFDAITRNIDTSISDYQKPNLNVKLAQTKIDTLKQTNLKTWIESAKKSGRGTKEEVDAARTTLFSLIKEGYGLLAQTATTADEFIINIDFGNGLNGGIQEYRMSYLNGADVPDDSAWSSVVNNRTFNAALDKAVAAHQNKKADVKVLETAINALKKSLLTFEGGTDEEGNTYAPQWFAHGSRESIATSISALKVTVAGAATTIPTLKVSALGSGADVSKDHILISSLKRTPSNLPILSEINAAFSKANSISKAKIGTYSKDAIIDAKDTLTRLITEAVTNPTYGNKENTAAAKAELKIEIANAQALVNAKKPLATRWEQIDIRMLETKIREANTVLNNKYASVGGTSYTMKNDGKVEANTLGSTIEGKKYDIIGATISDGIRAELAAAVASVDAIE
ncbi:hypothetical protein AN640_06635 [Candidatus Epulonipiscium fishelsonii]|uniref:Uncharacterized protein n=1 Tax=Candidatus Epulonipiscium fishelsonii TaxID=77094 RepID=A0ACC8XHP3_9FIRM|nr:hypothetical protein AN640_06635 [Epulopiscium sp. SCG-D08WGA-EpuloA1]